MNKCTIIGNLVKNPELRSTTAGVTVCGFTVAVNRKKTANNPDPGADYFNISAWRGLGDICGKYLQKGSKVYVSGSVSVRTWSKEDKHGASLEITADDVEFLTPRAESSPADAASGFQAVETDELPFD